MNIKKQELEKISAFEDEIFSWLEIFMGQPNIYIEAPRCFVDRAKNYGNRVYGGFDEILGESMGDVVTDHFVLTLNLINEMSLRNDDPAYWCFVYFKKDGTVDFCPDSEFFGESFNEKEMYKNLGISDYLPIVEEKTVNSYEIAYEIVKALLISFTGSGKIMKPGRDFHKRIYVPSLQQSYLFSEGKAIIGSYGNNQYIDVDGKILFNKKKFYNAQQFQEGFALIQNDPKRHNHSFYFIDHSGKKVFGNEIFDWAYGFSEGCAVVQNENFKRYYIDYSGNHLFNGKTFHCADPFAEGKALVYDDNSDPYFIDHSGKNLFPNLKIESAGSFCNGFAHVQIKGSHKTQPERRRFLSSSGELYKFHPITKEMA
jgi:hypothetical protein